MPEVSVIVPFYRESTHLLARALTSIEEQSVSCQPVVIDSSDGGRGAEPADRYGVKYVWQEANGPGAARNAGIEASDGEWIAFLDADDIWLPERLRPRLAHARENDAPLVWSDQGVSHSGAIRRWQRQPAHDVADHVDYQIRHYGQGIPSRTVVVRADILPERPFCEALAAREDPHLWTRLLSEHDGVRLPEVTAIKDKGTSGLSDNAERVYQAELESIARLAVALPSIQEHRPEREAIAAWRYARKLLRAGRCVEARRALQDCRDTVPVAKWRAIWALTHLPMGHDRAYRVLNRAQEVVA